MTDRLRALYVCYLSIEDPLVQTQVVSYLEGLARSGHAVSLITFDPAMDRGRKRSIEQQLARRGVAWRSQRYHKRPSLPATVLDVIVGTIVCALHVRRNGVQAIHARNHVPAAMALGVRALTGCRLIFDIRGLMAEEYVEAGRWKRDGLAYRLTTAVQRSALRRASGVVVLTEAVRPLLATGDAEIQVIPCCADLEGLEEDATHAEAVRAEIDAGARPVMVYVGKFTGWYMEREMAEFYASARSVQPDLLFLIITQADPEPMLDEFRRCGIGAEDYRVLAVAPHNLGRYLAASQFGVSFIRPGLAKRSSSPTKIGEYLGAGLPVVSSAGIGDLDSLLAPNRVGVLVDDFSPTGYAAAARAIRALCDEPDVRARCKALAAEELSLEAVGIPRYDRIYRRVASTIPSSSP